MNVAFVGLACLQVATRWHGAISALCFALGISFSALVLAAERRSRGQKAPIAPMLVRVNTYVGTVVGVTLLVSLIVHSAPGGAGALIAFGDGYVAALCAGLLFFLRRPSEITD